MIPWGILLCNCPQLMVSWPHSDGDLGDSSPQQCHMAQPSHHLDGGLTQPWRSSRRVPS